MVQQIFVSFTHLFISFNTWLRTEEKYRIHLGVSVIIYHVGAVGKREQQEFRILARILVNYFNRESLGIHALD